MPLTAHRSPRPLPLFPMPAPCRGQALLSALHLLGDAVAAGASFSELTPGMLAWMRDGMQLESGTIAQLAADGAMTFHEGFGPAVRDADATRRRAALVAEVVAQGQPLLLPGCGKAGITASAQRHPAPLLDTLCVPLIHDATVPYVIHAERRPDAPRPLTLDGFLLGLLADVLAPALARQLQAAARPQADAPRFKPANIVGDSAPMLAIYRLIERVRHTRTTVLILGESGVGKEGVASAIHHNSAQAAGPYVRFNCAALPESVIESELFGHERGAFTGALQRRQGRFEEANGGTIFLDEIGELSPAMQAKLLRVLQEKRFERLGGNFTYEVDLRIMAATNRNLREMVAQGRFREDLYYRLNVFPITLPALRERSEDIPALAEHFIGHFAHRMALPPPRLSAPAQHLLLRYRWPGNVRELENVIERAMLLVEDGVIRPAHLPPALQALAGLGRPGAGGAGSLSARMDAVEYEMIVQTLETHRGNTTAAAAALGLTRRVLGLRMAKHRLDHRVFRKDGPPA